MAPPMKITFGLLAISTLASGMSMRFCMEQCQRSMGSNCWGNDASCQCNQWSNSTTQQAITNCMEQECGGGFAKRAIAHMDANCGGASSSQAIAVAPTAAAALELRQNVPNLPPGLTIGGGTVIGTDFTVEPGTVFAPSATVVSGSVIAPGVTVNSGSVIAPGVTVNSGTVIAPSVTVGGGTVVAPSVTVQPGTVDAPGVTVEPGSVIVGGQSTSATVPASVLTTTTNSQGSAVTLAPSSLTVISESTLAGKTTTMSMSSMMTGPMTTMTGSATTSTGQPFETQSVNAAAGVGKFFGAIEVTLAAMAFVGLGSAMFL